MLFTMSQRSTASWPRLAAPAPLAAAVSHLFVEAQT
jgi:hypothetical protein